MVICLIVAGKLFHTRCPAKLESWAILWFCLRDPRLAILVEHRLVTDRQTQGLTYSALAKRHAVKQYEIDAQFLLKSNRKSYALYRTVTLPVTLSDPITAPSYPNLYMLHRFSYLRSGCS